MPVKHSTWISWQRTEDNTTELLSVVKSEPWSDLTRHYQFFSLVPSVRFSSHASCYGNRDACIGRLDGLFMARCGRVESIRKVYHLARFSHSRRQAVSSSPSTGGTTWVQRPEKPDALSEKQGSSRRESMALISQGYGASSCRRKRRKLCNRWIITREKRPILEGNQPWMEA